MTRISKSPFFQNKAFQAIWFGLLGSIVLGSIYSGAYKQNILSIVAPCLMMIAGYYSIKKMSAKLFEEVYDCGDYLLAKKGGEEEHIPLSKISCVDYSPFNKPPTITLHLTTPGKFGDEILFYPPAQRFSFTVLPHSPIADDLIARVNQAKIRFSN